MTPEEFKAARQRLDLSDDALAAELNLTPHVVRAWSDGRVAVPARFARTLAWRAALAERQAAFASSGLPECEWIKREVRRIPEQPDELERFRKALEEHQRDCQICQARQRFDRDLDARIGPMPPMPRPSWIAIFEWLQRLPRWTRPAAAGAAVLAAITLIRAVFMIPAGWRDPSRLILPLLAVLLAAAAGAFGGLVYAGVRDPLRRLGRAGDYVAGIICVWAYLGALAAVAPLAFGETFIEDRAGLITFLIIGAFFGLVVGHTWFRTPARA